MMSVRYVLRPDEYVVYFDRLPRPTETWRCAVGLADRLEKHTLPLSMQLVHWRPVRGGSHRSDQMRIHLLEKHGGIYLDHDAYALGSFDALRRCDADVIGGYEAFVGVEKMNNGILLARAGARFFKLWRDAYQTEFTLAEWDYSSCVVPFRLAQAHPDLALAVRGGVISPLPLGFNSSAEQAAYLRRAAAVHITALHHFRAEQMDRDGVMLAIAERIRTAAARAGVAQRGGRQARLARPHRLPPPIDAAYCLRRAADSVANMTALLTA